MRLKPTQSGRFLMGASDMPLNSDERSELAAIAENPEAAKRLTELASAAEMGLRLEYSKSSAFIGLLVADVLSAELSGFSAPQVQMLCEDDKVRILLLRALRWGCAPAASQICSCVAGSVCLAESCASAKLGCMLCRANSSRQTRR